MFKILQSELSSQFQKEENRLAQTVSRSDSISSVWNGENHNVFSCSSRASDRRNTVLQIQQESKALSLLFLIIMHKKTYFKLPSCLLLFVYSYRLCCKMLQHVFH